MGARVEAYKKYISKLTMLNFPENSSWVQCKVDEELDDVILEKVHCGNSVVTIPSFVQSIPQRNWVTWNIPNNSITYKIIYNGKWERTQNLDGMFICSFFKYLDLTEFKLSGIRSMSSFFAESRYIETVKFGNETVDSLEDIQSLCRNCSSLREIDMSELKLSNLKYMNGSFMDTPIEKANLAGINSRKLEYMIMAFRGCTDLSYLVIQPRTWGYTKGCGANTNNLFDGCNNLLKGKITTKDKNIREAINLYRKIYMTGTYLNSNYNLWG